MSGIACWNQHADILWSDKNGFRLVIHLPSGMGYVRFVVVDRRRPGNRRGRLVGSGTREDVGTAKDAVERMADRLMAAGGAAEQGQVTRCHAP
jgi:hypothetical protein